MEKCMDTTLTTQGFLELKAQREEMESASERKRQSVLRMELEMGETTGVVPEQRNKERDWSVLKQLKKRKYSDKRSNSELDS